MNLISNDIVENRTKGKDFNLFRTLFSSHLFWDTDKTQIDFEKSKPYIIERVLSHGLLSDWFLLKELYGKETIRQVVLTCRYLDKSCLNFCAAYFDEPKDNFRCYKLAQSIPTHWDY
jgi:hypothetical protein